MNLQEKKSMIQEAALSLEHASVKDVILFAVEKFPNLTLACSFGAEDVVLVDLLQKTAPGKEIFYLDTDFHFKETYEVRNRLMERYPGIKLIQVKPIYTPEQQASEYGNELWKTDPNMCCNIRKVEPLTRILSQYDAWITGIRRKQAPTRANAKKVEYDAKFEIIKFNPIVNWSYDDVWTYIREHNVPYNALHDYNYPSIGCHYCTRQVMPGEDPRAGRWSGSEKTECGLHR